MAVHRPAYGALDVSLDDGESTADPSRRSLSGRLRDTERRQSVGMLLRHKSADEDIDRTLSDHVDMDQVMRDAEEERKARQLAEDGQRSLFWMCARRVLCGETLLVKMYGGRYWRTTQQLYREQAELEAIRVVMVEGQPQAVGRMLQRTEEQLAADDKADDGHRVITSIFLRTWLKRKIEQAKVRVSCSTSAPWHRTELLTPNCTANVIRRRSTFLSCSTWSTNARTFSICHRSILARRFSVRFTI
eukprot:COSAG06_NODE_455_length_15521_cov_8.312022_20_plen_246_part_00